MMSVGLVWVVAERFGSSWVPLYTALVTLPHLVLAPWNGPIVSRFGALPTLIRTSAIRSVLLVAAGVAAWFLAAEAHRGALMAIVFAVGLVSGVIGAFFNPAVLSLPVRIAREPSDVGPLTALIDATFSVSNIAGPLCSALAFTLLGLPGLLGATGLSFAWAWWMSRQCIENARAEESLGTQNTDTPAPSPESAWTVVLRHPLIARTLFAFLLLNLVVAPIAVFFPAYTREIYSSGIGGYAALETALGIGMILGGLALSVLTVERTGRLIVVSIFTIALAYLAFSLSRDATVGALAAFVIGVAASLANISILGYFQTEAPASETAQIMSVVNLISVACVPVSMAFLTIALPWTGLRPLAIGCATLYFALASGIGFLPGLRNITAPKPSRSAVPA